MSRTGSLLVCLAAYAAALAAALLVATAARAALPALPPWVPRPLALALIADLAATVVVFAFSLAFDNSSIYDPYWSLTPPLLGLYWLGAYGAGMALDPRRVLVLALLAIWALRLTGNWVARWRGLADEDWRYADFRRRFGRWYWPVSFAGIHLFPTLIVFLASLSLHELLRTPYRGVRALDIAAVLVTAGAIALEALADRQLRRFLRRRTDPRQVLAQGLWGLCRHPNYLGEVLFWWGLYLFCLAASPRSWWAGAGPLAMTAMFVMVSVPWMDRHLTQSRPGYAAHARAIPALLPRLRANPAPRSGETAGPERSGRG